MIGRALKIEGFTKQSELELLQRLAASMPEDAVVIEVGSFRGRSTVAIAEGLAQLERPRLVAVDTFAGDPGWENIAKVDDARRLFDRNTAGIAFLEVIQEESVRASGHIADSSVDWVFIDALHDYRSVRDDIRAWAPKLKPDALMSGHDYGRADVTDAVLAVYSNVEVEHSIWMTRETPSVRFAQLLRAQIRGLLRRPR
ncbi:MAG TPA: class I SAM-dependent methyltransferase [Gaiellaceae bacterium]|nr:class I SAM-dependent methyltransferase [Gaiellaceae bacterium]